MNLNVFTSVVFLASACNKIADAAITAWTTPTINTKDGSAAVTTVIPESVAAAGVTGVSLVATLSPTNYSIVTQDSGTPTIQWAISSTGVLTFSSGTLDYETKKTYIIVVTATDVSTTGTATVTLSIGNVDEPPVFSGQYAVTIPDGSTTGTVLTTVSAKDPEGVAVTYGLTDASFTISSTGIITVKTGVTLAAATKAGYSLTVTATDATANVGSATVYAVVKTCSGTAEIAASLILILGCFLAALQ